MENQESNMSVDEMLFQVLVETFEADADEIIQVLAGLPEDHRMTMIDLGLSADNDEKLANVRGLFNEIKSKLPQ